MAQRRDSTSSSENFVIISHSDTAGFDAGALEQKADNPSTPGRIMKNLSSALTHRAQATSRRGAARDTAAKTSFRSTAATWGVAKMADKNGGEDFPGHPDDEDDEEEAVGGLEDDIFFRGNYARKPAGQNFRRPLDPDPYDGEGTRSLMAPLKYTKPSGWAKAAKKSNKRAGSLWPCFGMRLRSQTMSDH